MYFDTHCHLTLFKDIPSIISNARANSVKYILAVSMYYDDNWNVLKLAEKYSEVIPALGIHPIEAPNISNVEQKLKAIHDLIFTNNIQIIGEIGLDRYFIKKEQQWKQQERIFRYFLELAVKNNFVINLHGKNAETELFDILAQYNIQKVVVHWFAGSSRLIKEGIDRGYYFSVTPAVLYSKKMQEVVKIAPKKQLLSESDGPVRYKGQSPVIGEPALMKEVVQKIAQIKGQDHQEIEQLLYNTAKKIFLNEK